MSLEFQLFPRSHGLDASLRDVVSCFETEIGKIGSESNNLSSNDVLELIRPHLEELGYTVETGKRKSEKIQVPVLYGRGNHKDKYFYADAVSLDGKIVIEVEAGRAVDNNQFLKDVFQACMMHQVEYLVLAVRNDYRGKNDFERVYSFLETMYISNRLKLPLSGILLLGY